MIFFDTSFLAAIELENDEKHEIAMNISKQIISGRYGSTYISDYVFDELISFLLGRTKDIQKVVKIGHSVKTSAKILRVSEAAFERAWAIFKNQKDTRLSFTDCTNITIMEENGINDIATFDREFQKIKGINVVT